ncbi:AMP-binding protein [Virgibacillus proomii]|uniref:AMP-binding protein n=1 Tax=Virgibacillus proomii TaxID=84407 RepID=UPI001C0FB974|nr:AMP-binding protein [Virgibacillus proomii]MBU5267524.1 AMP-binding protein [Virgibacillus proomii]
MYDITTSENSYELVVAIFSLISLDITIIPTDNRLSDKELVDLMNEINVDFIIAENNSDIFADKYIPLVLEKDRVVEKTTEEINFKQWMKRSNALILFTSGSSGKPKIIVKSGETLISNIKQTIKNDAVS